MKEEILKLKSEGKSYREIEKLLGCSKGTVAYHCGEGQKEKTNQRNKKWKNNNPLKVKFDNWKTSWKYKFRTKVNSFKLKDNSQARRGPVNSDIISYTDVVRKIDTENPICYLTGRSIDFSKPDTYQFDHFIPVSKGGDNSIDNLELASKEANMAKSDLLLEEFLSLCVDVLKHNGYSVVPKG